MKLLIKRTHLKENYTIGELYIDGIYFCDTLEDVVRPDGDKVFGKTAIPTGKYKMIINYSNRFKRELPLICNVPNFEGIRLHAGNTAEDTHGCPLVGVNDEVGRLNKSALTMGNLMRRLVEGNSKLYEIEVTQ